MSKDEVAAIKLFNEWFEQSNFPIVNWVTMRRSYIKGFMTAITLINNTIKETQMAKKPAATKAAKLTGNKKAAKVIKKSVVKK